MHRVTTTLFASIVILMLTTQCRTVAYSRAQSENNSTANVTTVPPTCSIQTPCPKISFPLDFVVSEKTLIDFRVDNPKSNLDRFMNSKTAGERLVGTPKLSPPMQTLSIEELSALYTYTKSDHDQINEDLKKFPTTGKLNNEAIIFTAVSGIRKLPNFYGTVYREMSLSKDSLAPVVDKYRQANLNAREIQLAEFVSTSIEQATTHKKEVQIEFTIESKTGVIIDKISGNTKEVIFAPGSFFNVTKFDDTTNPITIHMTEIIHGENS